MEDWLRASLVRGNPSKDGRSSERSIAEVGVAEDGFVRERYRRDL